MMLPYFKLQFFVYKNSRLFPSLINSSMTAEDRGRRQVTSQVISSKIGQSIFTVFQRNKLPANAIQILMSHLCGPRYFILESFISSCVMFVYLTAGFSVRNLSSPIVLNFRTTSQGHDPVPGFWNFNAMCT